ncbi:MAG: transcriptional repressor NrdR [Synergistetes bacterium]|nr:transcriptional repressor NrdR [Synergistota bacterium]
MKCPFCGSNETKVVDSREVENGSAIRRRRLCLECGRRFTTYERVERTPLIVIKKDGRRELFDQQKVLNGILKACEKRNIPMEEIERIASSITNKAYEGATPEISSRRIGELVMEELKSLDQVAYVRFASVYREFRDVDQFLEALKELSKNGGV